MTRHCGTRLAGVGLTLALVAGCTGGGRDGASGPAGAVSWLTDVTAESGLDFTFVSGAKGEMHMPEIMGSGVALLDYDGDGDLDLYFTNGHANLPAAEGDGSITDRLWRQEAAGRFVDVTREAGLGDPGYGMGVAVGDVDNDGDVDLYVTNLGSDRLYRNRGDGTFEDASTVAGISGSGWSASAVFCDYDRDGWLDLYVTQYVEYRPAKKCSDDTGQQDYCGPKVFKPIPDLLLHNDGDGTFTDASVAAGIAQVAAAGLGVVCEDFDDDGWPDFYVANDAYANNLWTNQRDGTFRDTALLAGCAFNAHGQAEAGMGVIAEDLDQDGHVDLFMTHLAVETNTYYRNLGGTQGFVDGTGPSGLGPSSMAFTGFGTVAFDLELDGDLDLAVANGRVNIRSVALPGTRVPPPLDVFAEPNLFYTNDGTGRFTLVEGAAAAFAAPIEISRGLAVGDIDGDGDQDLVLSNIEGPARILRNDAPREGHWLAIRARDPRLARDTLGARVTVAAGARRWTRSAHGGSSYQSANPAVAHFGLGPAATVDAIDVRWPDGTRERFAGGPADRTVVLERGSGEALP